MGWKMLDVIHIFTTKSLGKTLTSLDASSHDVLRFEEHRRLLQNIVNMHREHDVWDFSNIVQNIEVVLSKTSAKNSINTSQERL